MVGPADCADKDLPGTKKEVVDNRNTQSQATLQHTEAYSPIATSALLWGLWSEASGASSRDHEVPPERPAEADFGAHRRKYSKLAIVSMLHACTLLCPVGSLAAFLIAIAVDA